MYHIDIIPYIQRVYHNTKKQENYSSLMVMVLVGKGLQVVVAMIQMILMHLLLVVGKARDKPSIHRS
jgi:hypothetical protein